MINLTQKRARKTLEKIEKITSLCNELGIEFDNLLTNHYKLIYKEVEYVFQNYNDMLNCLELIKVKESEIK
ncbi:MAG: hypothetical protein MSA15_20070 [Clostridium sp.]|nr:hypothetical protein [Clostridium sp.]